MTTQRQHALRRLIPLAAAVALAISACSTTVGGQPPTDSISPPDTVANPGVTVPTTPEGAPGDTTTTTVADVAFTPTSPPVEEPAFEAMTITTDDGLDLFARYWPGGSTAVLYTHHIQTALSGPQDSTFLGPWAWGLVEAGYTVLTPDFRGHGESPGEAFANDSKADIEAFYQFLADEGYETIVALASRGSAPVLVNVDGANPDVTFDGIGVLFPPLSRNGNDLKADLPLIEAPVWIVHIDAGSSGGIPKRLVPVTPNLYDDHLFARIPSGLQFIDVSGDEYMGRMLAFIEHVESSN